MSKPKDAARSRSKKTIIVESLFRDPSRWDDLGNLVRPVVSVDEIRAAIDENNQTPEAVHVKPGNVYAFFKDLVRRTSSANLNWPESVLKAGFTGVQNKGEGNSFEFIPLPSGQTTAFNENMATYPREPTRAKVSVIQTLSLPTFNKVLSRADENWLQSIAIELHLPQSHLAFHHQGGLALTEVRHMQSNLKQNRAEIDGLLCGTLSDGNLVLITMEAKGDKDDVLDSQVLDQIEAVQKMPAVRKALAATGRDSAKTQILPMAMKLVPMASVDPTCATHLSQGTTAVIYMADYQCVPLDGTRPSVLQINGETLFDLLPPIPGINA